MTTSLVVKICGLTTEADADDARAAGADLLGLNLVAGPRRVTPERAEQLLNSIAAADATAAGCAVLLARLTAAGYEAGVAELLERWPTVALQVYGEVTPERVAALVQAGRRVLLPWPVASRADWSAARAFVASCGPHPPTYVLIDAKVPGQLGGTGVSVDAGLLTTVQAAEPLGVPILLAGGLTPTNVAAAVQAVQPAGVDVSSGVETSPGRKDPALMRAFVAATRSA